MEAEKNKYVSGNDAYVINDNIQFGGTDNPNSMSFNFGWNEQSDLEFDLGSFLWLRCNISVGFRLWVYLMYIKIYVLTATICCAGYPWTEIWTIPALTAMDWQEIGSNNAYAGSYTTFQSGRVNCNITGDQFCAAFDIARTKGSGSPILHNYSGGSGEFIFGVMDSDLFYVGRPEDTGCGVYVFDQIACPSRSIVYLSKAANDFTLGYYDGEVGRTFSQTISLPAADTGVTGFNLQMGDAGLPGYQTNYFELHEAFIMAAKGQASGMKLPLQ